MVSIPHRSRQRHGGGGRGGAGGPAGMDGREHPSCGELAGGKNMWKMPPTTQPLLTLPHC